jgi:hypothetical protein
VLILFSPALLITRVADGRAGLRTLLRALLRFDVRTHRYALPLVAVPALAPGLDVLAAAWRPRQQPAARGLRNRVPACPAVPVPLHELLGGIGLAELLPGRLQRRHGPMKAVLITTPWPTLEHVSLAFGGTGGEGVAWFAVVTVVIVPIRATLA